MSLTVKLYTIAFSLAILFIGVFLIFGGSFEAYLTDEALSDWFTRSKPYAWAVAIGLLISDLVLPVPGTVVMSALGAVYGVWLGGILAAIGSFLSGSFAYLLGRIAGKRWMSLLASKDEIHHATLVFEKWGGAGIAITRSGPILPEVLTLMAGVLKMPYYWFATCLLIGAIPTGFLFAYTGAIIAVHPGWGVTLTLLFPALVWIGLVMFKTSRP